MENTQRRLVVGNFEHYNLRKIIPTDIEKNNLVNYIFITIITFSYMLPTQ